MKFTIRGKDNDFDCFRARNMLQTRGIEYELIIDPTSKICVITIGKKHIGGYYELMQYLEDVTFFGQDCLG